MKEISLSAMRMIINIIQALLVVILCVSAGLLGILIKLTTWNSDWVLTVVPRWFWFPLVSLVTGVKVKVYGSDNVDKEHSYIYAANHESHLDIPAVVHAIKVPLYFIVKKELKKVPFIGWYISAVGMVFVDRSNKEKARKSMLDAGMLIKNGKNVIVYPEGTRSKDGTMGIFRRGAFTIASKADVGVVPVAIKGARELLRSGSLKLKSGTIHLSIGTPIYHKDHPELGIDEFAQLVKAKVIAMRKQMPDS